MTKIQPWQLQRSAKGVNYIKAEYTVVKHIMDTKDLTAKGSHWDRYYQSLHTYGIHAVCPDMSFAELAIAKVGAIKLLLDIVDERSATILMHTTDKMRMDEVVDYNTIKMHDPSHEVTEDEYPMICIYARLRALSPSDAVSSIEEDYTEWYSRCVDLDKFRLSWTYAILTASSVIEVEQAVSNIKRDN